MSYYFVAYIQNEDASHGLFPKHFRHCVSKVHPLKLVEINLNLHLISWQKITKKEYNLGVKQMVNAPNCGLREK